jgi:hypothetical protein
MSTTDSPEPTPEPIPEPIPEPTDADRARALEVLRDASLAHEGARVALRENIAEAIAAARIAKAIAAARAEGRLEGRESYRHEALALTREPLADLRRAVDALEHL